MTKECIWRDHGTLKRYWAGCKCPDCVKAITCYVAHRERERKAGRPGLVSSMRSRDHLKKFKTLQHVADVLGMSGTAVWRIKTGRVKQVLARTEQRILALTPNDVQAKLPFVIRDGTYVSAAKTRKLIHLLKRQGFSENGLGLKLGVRGGLRIRGKRVRASNEMRIEKFYNMVTAEAA